MLERILEALKASGHNVVHVEDEALLNAYLDNNVAGEDTVVNVGKHSFNACINETHIAVFYEEYVLVDGVESDEVDLFGVALFERK